MNEPSSFCENPSTRTDLAKSILDCVDALDRAGFPRPASLSPDAYLAAIGELDDRWAADAFLLSRTYAELRFGACSYRPTAEIGSESRREATWLACTRLARAISSDSAKDNGREGEAETEARSSLAAIAEAWRARWIGPIDEPKPIEIPAPPAYESEERLDPLNIPSSPASRVSAERSLVRSAKAKSRPARRFFSRPRTSRGGVPVWNVAALALATTVLAGVGGIFGERCGLSTLLTTGGASQIDFSNGPLVMLSGPIQRDLNVGKPDVGLPEMFPSHYPHAERFNGAISAAWLEIAELFCEVDRCDRADAIYHYVAKTLPRDPTVHVAYASFLLTAPDLAYRSPGRALEFAEYGYELDPGSDLAAETLATALYATGDVARAVAIQQERLDGARRPDFAGIPQDDPADRNAG